MNKSSPKPLSAVNQREIDSAEKYGSRVATTGSVKPETAMVGQLIEQLAQQLERVEKEVTALGDRMSPIIKEEDSSTANMGYILPLPSCAFAEHLIACIEVSIRLATKLSSLHGRVQL